MMPSCLDVLGVKLREAASHRTLRRDRDCSGPGLYRPNRSRPGTGRAAAVLGIRSWRMTMVVVGEVIRGQSLVERRDQVRQIAFASASASPQVGKRDASHRIAAQARRPAGSDCIGATSASIVGRSSLADVRDDHVSGSRSAACRLCEFRRSCGRAGEHAGAACRILDAAALDIEA